MKVNHSFGPFYNRDSEILILGSFPSVISRKESFYYMNKTNRFWSILSKIYNEDFVNEDISIKKKLLTQYKIALYDVIEECDIIGSSDSSIKSVIPADLERIIKNSNIKKIYINGGTAFKHFAKYFNNYLDIAFKLPSTSAANAKMRIDDLIKEWIVIKNRLF